MMAAYLLPVETRPVLEKEIKKNIRVLLDSSMVCPSALSESSKDSLPQLCVRKMALGTPRTRSQGDLQASLHLSFLDS